MHCSLEEKKKIKEISTEFKKKKKVKHVIVQCICLRHDQIQFKIIN